jgi:hypothetical protein
MQIWDKYPMRVAMFVANALVIGNENEFGARCPGG